MLNSMFVSMNGKYVLQRKMETITNNIANSSTAGFKASRPAFKISVEETEMEKENRLLLPNTRISELEQHTDFSEAPLAETGNRFDLAIQGDGFFVVRSKDGNTRYTRNGQFTLDQDKKLVTMDGSTVMGRGGEITLDGKEIVVQDDGTIYVDKQQSDTVKVVTFENKAALRHAGRSSFVNEDPDATETIPTKFTVKAGCYESSNVNIMIEMVDMMSVMRAYETYTKIDQALNDQMTKLLDIAK